MHIYNPVLQQELLPIRSHQQRYLHYLVLHHPYCTCTEIDNCLIQDNYFIAWEAADADKWNKMLKNWNRIHRICVCSRMSIWEGQLAVHEVISARLRQDIECILTRKGISYWYCCNCFLWSHSQAITDNFFPAVCMIHKFTDFNKPSDNLLFCFIHRHVWHIVSLL